MLRITILYIWSYVDLIYSLVKQLLLQSSTVAMINYIVHTRRRTQNRQPHRNYTAHSVAVIRSSQISHGRSQKVLLPFVIQALASYMPCIGPAIQRKPIGKMCRHHLLFAWWVHLRIVWHPM